MKNVWSPCWVLDEISFLASPVESVTTLQPKARYLNSTLQKRMSIPPGEEATIEYFGRFQPLQGHQRHLWALAYHGHQFQNYNPNIGDGRGFSFAQFKDERNILRELGTKGSGHTPFSRSGDGRLTLKGAVREALASAQLNYFGLDCSHTLSIVETEQPLERNDEPSPTRSAILVRVCQSHLRIGTFQRLKYLNEIEKIESLITYSQKHLGFSKGASVKTWLHEVTENLARMTAQWMIFGFVHGVLNTDNINITGEVFDFGPYRFLPKFDPQMTAAYFDTQGLYRFGHQPQIMVWNLHQLFLCVEPLDESMNFDTFLKIFQGSIHRWAQHYFCKRLGMHIERKQTDGLDQKVESLMQESFDYLYRSQIDYQSFYSEPLVHNVLLEKFGFAPNTKQSDPLQNLLYDEIESIWQAIDTADNWGPFNTKLESLGAKNCLSQR